MTPQDFDYLRRLLRERSGLVLSAEKQYLAESRLLPVARKHGLGSLGELDVSASLGFKIVDASTGAVVFTGTLTSRPDVGYLYSPTPYQSVLEADFSAFTTPGTYKLTPTPGLAWLEEDPS